MVVQPVAEDTLDFLTAHFVTIIHVFLVTDDRRLTAHILRQVGMARVANKCLVKWFCSSEQHPHLDDSAAVALSGVSFDPIPHRGCFAACASSTMLELRMGRPLKSAPLGKGVMSPPAVIPAGRSLSADP